MNFRNFETIVLISYYLLLAFGVNSESQEEFGEKIPRSEVPPNPPRKGKYKPTVAPETEADSTKWETDSCDLEADENMKHVIKTSKYFINTNADTFRDKTPEEIIKDCESHGLTAMEIRHFDDYLSIQNLFRIKGYKLKHYAPLGISDNFEGGGHHGEWKYMNKDDLTFSAWASGKPDNVEAEKRCADLGVMGNGSYLYWNDLVCSSTLAWKEYIQICQFPVGHDCYESSDEEKARIRRKGENLYPIGETATRKFYSSYAQRTMKKAKEFCTSNGYTLFDFSEFPNDDVMLEIYTIHENNLRKLESGPWTYFWTSAYLDNYQKPKQGWKWLSTGDRYTYPEYDDSRKVQIALEAAIDPNRIDGKCLAYFWKVEEGQPHKLVLRPIKCNLPFFFYCYEEIEKLSEPSNDT